MSFAMDFHVQDPDTWRKRVEMLSPEGLRVLTVAHEHHVPMTPGLAGKLEVSARGVAGELSHVVFTAACKVLDQKIQHRQFVKCRFEILFDFLIAPLVRRAASDCKRGVLFGPAAMNPIPESEALAWEQDMDAALRALIEVPDRMTRSFWIVAGFAVLGDPIRQANRAGGFGSGIGQEPEPMMANLIADIEPLFDRSADALMQPRKAQQVEMRRAGIKPREGGIEGIMTSRSLDDIDEILPSELCMPKELLTIKIADEGFLIKHRPPYRLPRRDLLVAVMIPTRAETLGPMLFRAATIDMLARLWLMLGQGGAPQVDIALVRGQLGRAQASAARINLLPPVRRRNAFRIDRATRLGLLVKTNLMPDAINSFPNGSALREGALADQFLLEALSSVNRVPDRSEHSKGRAAGVQITLNDYKKILAIAAVPRGEDGFLDENITGSDAASALLAQMALPASIRETGLHVACPKRQDLSDGYDLGHSDGIMLNPILPGEEDETERIARTIGGLSQFLIERIYEALNDV